MKGHWRMPTPRARSVNERQREHGLVTFAPTRLRGQVAVWAPTGPHGMVNPLSRVRPPTRTSN
jgi:hypothetical protein